MLAASQGPFGEQAEWAQHYDADPHLAVTRSTTPIFSPETVAATEQAIETYQQIVARGGWRPVPADHVLKLGVNGGAGRRPAPAARGFRRSRRDGGQLADFRLRHF